MVNPKVERTPGWPHGGDSSNVNLWEGLTPPYATIVVDPPWEYVDGWGTRWRTIGAKKPRTTLPYSSMSITQIAALPIGEVAATNAHIYLWTTNRYLRDAYDVVQAWDFRPSQLLTWCKPLKGIGPGGAFSQSTEHVLFARRGKLPMLRRGNSTWFQAPRGPHSTKPPAFLDLVEQVSPGPYVELFARQPRLGWDSWGHGFEHLGETPHAG